MTDFLIDNTALPFPKTDLVAIPGGADVTKYVNSSNWNSVCQGATDLRNFLRAQVPVNLRAVGCVPRDATKGADNVAIINSLIAAAKAASRPLALFVDDWFYIDKAGTNWSIKFESGCQDMAIVGAGRYTSGFIQHGTGTGNDWYGMLIDRGKRIGLHNFGMYQGEILMASTGQHDHLIQIANLGGSSESCDAVLSNLYLGKALGDCVNFYGGTGLVSASLRDVDINGYGFVLKTWTQGTAYAVGAYIRNGTNAYYCTVAGTSAASGGGPTGTGAAIVDGSCTWSTLVGGATYRFAARSGIAFQRGYDRVLIDGFRIKGIQNSGVDMESSSTGTLKHAHFANGVVDNGTTASGQKGNTATIFSFSGSTSQTDPSKYSTVDNVTIINGSMQIAETRNARVSRVRIVQEEPPAADTSTACMYVMQSNDGLVLESCQIHRVGTSAAGELLNIQGTGNVTVAGSWTFEQATAADIIGGEPSNDIVLAGDFAMKYSGTSPSTKAAVNFTALNRDVDRPKISGIRLESTTGAMKALAVLATRNGQKMRDIAITNCFAKDGTVTRGVYFSKASGTTMDANPILQGCDFGDGALFDDVDINDTPISEIFPLVDGNKQGPYTLVGDVDPTNNVKAPQGTRYIWRNGDSTKFYIKKEGNAATKGGWSEVTVGTASLNRFDLPTTSADWTVHIANNALSVAAPTRSWGCQDSSGNLAAVIGSLALTAAGTPTYEQDESALGYPNADGTQSVGLQDNEADAFATTDAALPDPSNTSMMMVVIGRFTSAAGPAAARSWFQMSETNVVRAVDSSGSLRGRIFFVGNDVTPAVNFDTDFHVWVGRANETANTALFGNEDFKSEPGYVSASTTAKRVGIGAFDSLNSPGFRALRIYQWEGANAEITNAQLKELIESFGAGVAWTP